ncbi:hypothetical protein [Candidatus Nitrospira bockiana]
MSAKGETRATRPAAGSSIREREVQQTPDGRRSRELLEELQDEAATANERVDDPQEKRRVVPSKPC